MAGPTAIRNRTWLPAIVAGIREVPRVLALAVPIVVGLTSSTLIGVIDTIMIAPLGTDALAAASLTTSALIIMYSALYGLISIIHVHFSRAEGANDPAGVASTLRNGLALAWFAGLLGMIVMLAGFPLLRLLDQTEAVINILLPYWIAKSCVLVPYALLSVYRGLFNSVHRPWTSTAVAMLAVVVNVPLNYLLIGGAWGWEGLGLLGAGVGSLLANGIALASAYLYWRFSDVLARYRQPVAWSARRVGRSFIQGLPISIGNLGEGSSYALAGLMLGLFGASALAANQIVHSIAAVMYMLPMGMTSAVGIRVGQAIGARQLDRLRAIGIGATIVVLAWMTVFLALLLLFRTDIANSLSKDPAVVSIAVTMFLTIAFTQFADGLQSTSLGALRGMIDIRVPTLITLVAYWLVALPCAYLLGFLLDFGPNGVWMGYGLGVFVAAITLQIRFWKRAGTSIARNTPVGAYR